MVNFHLIIWSLKHWQTAKCYIPLLRSWVWIQLKCCCSSHGQNPDWSSMPQNMLQKLSSLTGWSIFWHWRSGLDDEFWKSWTTPAGLIDDGNRGLLVGWVDRGLSIAGVLEMSSLISELFSLLLLQEPSVSLILRLMDSVGSLLFSANICSHCLTNQDESCIYIYTHTHTQMLARFSQLKICVK